MKQKAAIEKTYAESLSKVRNVVKHIEIIRYNPLQLSGAYVGRKVGRAGLEQGEQGQTVTTVWLRVLEENEKIAQLRLAAAQVIYYKLQTANCFVVVQVFQEKISDEARALRGEKATRAKQQLERLAGVQKEVWDSVSELDRARARSVNTVNCGL